MFQQWQQVSSIPSSYVQSSLLSTLPHYSGESTTTTFSNVVTSSANIAHTTDCSKDIITSSFSAQNYIEQKPPPLSVASSIMLQTSTAPTQPTVCVEENNHSAVHEEVSTSTSQVQHPNFVLPTSEQPIINSLSQQ